MVEQHIESNPEDVLRILQNPVPKNQDSSCSDQSKEATSPPSSPGSKKVLNIGKIVRRAASVAKYAVAAAFSAQNGGYEEEMLPLKCCLMSISLPWEHIAHDLLFEGSPPVNL